jgi:hypothetical protein
MWSLTLREEYMLQSPVAIADFKKKRALRRFANYNGHKILLG